MFKATAFLLLAAGACAAQDTARGHWPQWRGPRRDNVSAETGLLKSWPEVGPPVLWDVHGLGTGIAAVSVADGRVFAIGYSGDGEYLTALDEGTGARLWASRLGPSVQENSLMRWLGQRATTVDGDRVYAVHAQGALVCFSTANGKELWRRDYVKDFGTTPHYWGICDRPLVEGDRLIVTPGGRAAAMAALDKKTGKTVWTSEPKGTVAHAATVVSTAAGVRQYVTHLTGKVVSFRASDGKHLWTHEPFGRTANSCTPIAAADDVIVTAGYGAGLAVLQLSASADGVQARPRYSQTVDVSPFQDSGLRVGDHLYLVGGNARSCVELATGKVAWTDRSTGRGLASMTYADGRLYIHHSEGTLALAEASPDRLRPLSAFKIHGWQPTSGATNPVVAGGRLYIRNESRLICFDVRESAAERPRPRTVVLEGPGGKTEPPAQAIYVPTPQDVVERMLDLAKVAEDDFLVDLGSGDGRVVLTAARKHGARTLGYEIDPRLVRESRSNIEKAGMKDRAAIEASDLFAAELGCVNVVALYLPEKYLERLATSFERLQPGARVVSHQFKIPGYVPDQVVQTCSVEDGDVHTLYLWTTPLKKEGR